ncbi:DUF6048 family protein [Mesonia sp. K7]|uniref:DUF6048 family protein n=1 Tax=Mesonia sp. K7 TaxID=2218606 RepID=UPI000DA8F55C|nr:DUF6048 family protein [Mesonia sp. K7]PZD77033.1 hypothetical protein DNG35_10350 [Mesonia sp. K7]
MKIRHIFIFIFSVLLAWQGFSQSKTANDSITIQEKYGIRIGVDISKPLRSVFDENYTGLEIIADYRIKKRLYAAAELGYDDMSYTEPYLDGKTSGNYIKLGANYNTYENWLNMQNEIFVGLRYGFSTFSHELDRYAIYTTDKYFETDIRNQAQEFSGLTASWAELQVGLKTEIFNNLFLSLHVQLKLLVTEKEPENYANLYIPGFNRTYGDGNIGVGWGYALSYMIPITKNEKKIKAGKVN